MAQFQHLPIYKSAYDLLIELMYITKEFPREYKYTLGEKIQNSVTELLIMIYKANSSKDKKEYIEKIIEDVQFLDIYLRICNDIKILPQARYCRLSQQTYAIAKQSAGWLKSALEIEPEPVCVKA